MFSPSAQCTEAANKAKRVIFMKRRSFQDLSKSTFIPLHGALVRPHLEYGMPACSPSLVADINHLERIQRLGTKLVTGMRHLPYTGRLQRLGLLGIDPNLFFLSPARRGLRGRPFKVLQGASHRQRRGSAVSVRVVKYWDKFPSSIVTAPPVNVFKKRLEEVWAEVFSHLSH